MLTRDSDSLGVAGVDRAAGAVCVGAGGGAGVSSCCVGVRAPSGVLGGGSFAEAGVLTGVSLPPWVVS